MPPKSRLVHLITIPHIKDDCNLFFAQTGNHIPFTIKRVYYITKANTKLPRGFHAHKKTQQIIFCIQGAIKLIVNNGMKKEEIVLDKANTGVFLDKMIWHEMTDFKKNTILLVVASKPFNEKDYIRDYEKFKKRANQIP